MHPETPEAVDRLRRVGIKKLVMMSGDHPGAARAVADRLGLCFAGLRPADKVGVVRRLLGEDNRMAMVKDGVNDAPALASDTLGIAMGPLVRMSPSRPRTSPSCPTILACSPRP